MVYLSSELSKVWPGQPKVEADDLLLRDLSRKLNDFSSAQHLDDQFTARS